MSSGKLIIVGYCEKVRKSTPVTVPIDPFASVSQLAVHKFYFAFSFRINSQRVVRYIVMPGRSKVSFSNTSRDMFRSLVANVNPNCIFRPRPSADFSDLKIRDYGFSHKAERTPPPAEETLKPKTKTRPSRLTTAARLLRLPGDRSHHQWADPLWTDFLSLSCSFDK